MCEYIARCNVARRSDLINHLIRPALSRQQIREGLLNSWAGHSTEIYRIDSLVNCRKNLVFDRDNGLGSSLGRDPNICVGVGAPTTNIRSCAQYLCT